METVQEFIQRNELTMDVERTDSNPVMEDSGNMDHWKCKIARATEGAPRVITVVFSMGRGHDGASPELAEVLDCMVSAVCSFADIDCFEDFASEYGYDTDSRKAESNYNSISSAVKGQAIDLEYLLHRAEMDNLLYNTEMG